jgi:hypothetical protein
MWNGEACREPGLLTRALKMKGNCWDSSFSVAYAERNRESWPRIKGMEMVRKCRIE